MILASILLVVADDVGVDRIGAYNEHPDPGRTPLVDSLADQGVLFRNAWSNPVCSPTRALILTGRYAFRTGIGNNVSFSGAIGTGLPASELTLPEVLVDYQSMLAGKWHLMGVENGPNHPMAFGGFDHHRGSLFNLRPNGPDAYFNWEKNTDGQVALTDVYATTDSVDEAIGFVQSATAPWLCVLSFNAGHKPLHEPPPSLHTYNLSGEPGPDHYRAMIEAMDCELGRLLAVVDLETTTVIFVGDNGTEPTAVTAPHDPNKAKNTMYEGGINVPLIIAGAGVEQNGECGALVNVTDIFATIVELAGYESTAEDSVSLVPYLENPRRSTIRQWTYAEKFRPNGQTGTYSIRWRAIRDRGSWKLIRRFGEDDELYHLNSDPFEENDLLDAPLGSAAQKAFDRLDAWMEDLR
jgi:arylsulfatase B